MTHMYAVASKDPIPMTTVPAHVDNSSNDHSNDDNLCALASTDTRNHVRQAIASTYQGYCSKVFVLGTCPRKQSGCPFDHSASALERCIRSFTLLSKRELHFYGQLPPWPQNIKDPTTHTRGAYTSNHPDGLPTFNAHSNAILVHFQIQVPIINRSLRVPLYSLWRINPPRCLKSHLDCPFVPTSLSHIYNIN